MNLILDDNNTSQQPASNYIIDSNDQSFMDDVINQSMSYPILVDFWAPWCEPCKQLTPLLEKQVNQARGKVRLVKINIDDNPMVAGQMGIQSIPAIIAFFQQRPIDAIQGAQQPAQIKSFIERLLKMAGVADDDVDTMLAQAEDLLENEDYASAMPLFEQVMQDVQDDMSALSGFLMCLLKLNEHDRLSEILDALENDAFKNERINSVKTMFDLIKNSDINPADIKTYTDNINNDPYDHASRIQLAKILIAQDKGQEACDHLLESIRLDREWNEEAARQELLTIFDALGGGNPIVMKSRRRLSSIIFA